MGLISVEMKCLKSLVTHFLKLNLIGPRLELSNEVKGDAKKKGTNVLVPTAKDITPRANAFQFQKVKIKNFKN